MILKKLSNSFLHLLWLATCIPETIKFKIASKGSLKKIQTNVLKDVIAKSTETEFGKFHNFADINSFQSFQKNVPISDYDSLLPWIEKIADGKKHILTSDEVTMFEKTSGSATASKLIPYTNSLQKAFDRALHPWLTNLYLNFPMLLTGPSYWVITPKTNSNNRTKGGIPIGFAADSEYFGKFGRYLIDKLMVVPSEVGKIADIDDWKYVTILFLLRCENLRLVSLWNPTFLQSLFLEIDKYELDLAADLSSGNCSRAKSFKGFRAKSMPERTTIFKGAIIELKRGNFNKFSQAMWPGLTLISSWTEAEAHDGAIRLRHDFPHATLQTKGILATEGAVTVPIVGAPAPVLAIRTAFFEFIDIENSNNILTADKVRLGNRYKLLMTTFGGLYRYQLNDVIRIKGFWNKIPCLEFIGKENKISDLCGEKLNAGHIKDVIKSLLGLSSTAFISPERQVERAAKPGYNLFVSSEELKLEKSELEEKTEKRLRENFHYNWCVEAGQLRSVKVVIIDCKKDEITLLRLKRLQQEKNAFSTAKIMPLCILSGWQDWLAKHARFID